MKKKKKFFTLVELLIVTSLILILISIMLPALKESLETARSINCSANLRQVGIGTTGYISDNDDWLYSAYFQEDRLYCYMTMALVPYYARHLNSKTYTTAATKIWSLSKFLTCSSDDKRFVAESNRHLPIATNYELTVSSLFIEGSSSDPPAKVWGGGHYKINSYEQKRFRQITPNSVYCVEAFSSNVVGVGNLDANGLPYQGLSPKHNINEGYTNGYAEGWTTYAVNSASFVHKNACSFLFTDGHVTRYKRGKQFNTDWTPR